MYFGDGAYRVEPWGTFSRSGHLPRARAQFIKLICHEGKTGLTYHERREIVVLLKHYNGLVKT